MCACVRGCVHVCMCVSEGCVYVCVSVGCICVFMCSCGLCLCVRVCECGCVLFLSAFGERWLCLCESACIQHVHL